MPSRSLFNHTCLITRNGSNSAKQLKNNTQHTAHQSQMRQRHQRNNGANSVSGTNGGNCNAESDIESPQSSGGTAAASMMASELENMCALSTACTHKNIHKKASEPKLLRGVMGSRALLWIVLCAVYVSCIWCAVSGNLYAPHHTC